MKTSGLEVMEAQHHVARTESLKAGQERLLVKVQPICSRRPSDHGTTSRPIAAVEWGQPEPTDKLCVLCLVQSEFNCLSLLEARGAVIGRKLFILLELLGFGFALFE